MKKRNFGIIAAIIVAFSVSVTGCFIKKEDKKDTTTTVTDASNTAVNSSIINLPKSLSSQPGGKKKFVRSGEGSGMSGIYYGVTQYIGMADMMKEMVKELLNNVVKDELLNNTAIFNTINSIPPDPNDPGAPKYFKIEKPAGEAYEWKISLYFNTQTSPDMIIRFTIVDGTAKGRVTWSMSDTDDDLAALGITVSITRSVDVTFDATTSKKTMEIRFVQDLESAYAPYLASSTWGALTTTQKDALDLGQPAKVFVNVEYENSVYTIYGTSYHPLWDDEATLSTEDMMWDNANRNIYMFKAKAIEGDGAKLYLALPLNTYNADQITNSWTNDSVGNIFTNMMVKQLNDMIAPLAGGSVAEKQQAFNMICWILGSNLYTDYGITPYTGTETFIVSQQSSAASFWAGSGMDSVFSSLANMQNTYNSLTTTTTLTKETLYKMIMAQAIVDKFNTLYNATGIGINKVQLEAFVNNPSIDPNAVSFQTMYKSIKSIINPAFFNEAQGFLGTLDEKNDTDATNDIFYQYTGGLLVESSDQSSISGLKSNPLLDLTGITMYVPADVVSATIVVQ